MRDEVTRPFRKLEDIEVALIALLQQNARRSMRDLAGALGAPKSTVWDQIRRLEGEGVILGYQAVIAPALLGADLDFIVSLTLEARTPIGIRCFETALRETPGLLGAIRVGPGAYQARAATREAIAALENAIATCGLTALEFRTTAVHEEIIAYRDPPIRSLIGKS